MVVDLGLAIKQYLFAQVIVYSNTIRENGYSESTSRENGCYRYGEIGGAYRDNRNECGVSGRYARFQQGKEYSVEATWRRNFGKSLWVQPAFQSVSNGDGDYVVLITRLGYEF